jgi:hypothetical protein
VSVPPPRCSGLTAGALAQQQPISQAGPCQSDRMRHPRREMLRVNLGLRELDTVTDKH